MKRILLDACTIILLAKASVLETLFDTYTSLMTEEVYKEVTAGKSKQFQDALLLERLAGDKKIKITNADTKITNKLIKDFNMGAGEASTIAASIKEREIIVATDNKQGRSAALINAINLVGSIEIIVILYKKKKISHDKAVTAIKILKEKGWFEPHLIDKAMEDLS